MYYIITINLKGKKTRKYNTNVNNHSNKKYDYECC